MISFECIHCSNHFRVPDEFAGRRGKCRVCNRDVVVPGAPAKAAHGSPHDEEGGTSPSDLARYALAKCEEYAQHLQTLLSEHERVERELGKLSEKQSRLVQIETRLNAAETALQGFVHQLGVDRKRSASIGERSEALEHAVGTVEDVLGKHEETLGKASRQVDRLGSALAQMRGTCERLTELHAQAETRSDKLEGLLKEMGQAMRHYEERQHESSALLAELKEAQGQLQASLLQLEGQASEQQQEAHRETKGLRELLEEFESRLGNLEGIVEATAARVGEIGEEWASSQSELDERLDALAASSAGSDADERQEALQKELHAVVSRLEGLEACQQEGSASVGALLDRIGQIEGTSREAYEGQESLGEVVASFRSELAALRRDMGQADDGNREDGERETPGAGVADRAALEEVRQGLSWLNSRIDALSKQLGTAQLSLPQNGTSTDRLPVPQDDAQEKAAAILREQLRMGGDHEPDENMLQTFLSFMASARK